MKKLFIICIASFCALQSIAQIDTALNTNMLKIDANSLLLKARKQQTAAWVLLGAGAGLFTAGVISAADNATDDLVNIFNPAHAPSNSSGGEILAITGAAAMLGSIPLFVASGKNKRKATLMLKDEKVYFNTQLNRKDHFAALVIRINL